MNFLSHFLATMGIAPATGLLLAWAGPAALGQVPGSIAWTSADVGGAIYSSPSQLANGDVVVGVGGSNPRVIAYTGAGAIRWQYSPGAGADWFDSSPAIAPDGTLYIGSWDGYLYALNSTDGTLKWRYPTGGYVLSAPALGADGTVFFGSSDGVFYALHPDGTRQWSLPLETDLDSSPAIGPDGTLYFGTHQGTLLAMNQNGTLRWSFKVETIAGREDLVRIQGAPAVAEDGTIYVGSGNHRLYALREVNGSPQVQWTFEAGDGLDAPPVIGPDGSIYLGCRDGYFHALSPDGTERWRVLVGDIYYAGAAVDVRGRVYVVGYAGRVNNMETSRLYAFSAPNPELPHDVAVLWTRDIAMAGKTNYVDSSLLLGLDGRLYFGAYNGRLYCVNTDSGNFPAQEGWPRFRHNVRGTGRFTLAPAFIHPLASQTVPLGTRFTLDGRVRGDGPFSHWWRRGGVVVSSLGDLYSANAVAQDAAIWEVTVMNPSGQFTRAHFPVIPVEPDRILETGTPPLLTQVYYLPTAPLSSGWVFEPQQSPNLSDWTSAADVFRSNPTPETQRREMSTPVTGHPTFLRVDIRDTREIGTSGLRSCAAAPTAETVVPAKTGLPSPDRSGGRADVPSGLWQKGESREGPRAPSYREFRRWGSKGHPTPGQFRPGDTGQDPAALPTRSRPGTP